MNSEPQTRCLPQAGRSELWLLYMYVASLILLPSGTIKGVPIKIPLFLPLVFITYGRIMRGTSPFWRIGVSFLSAAGLSLWTAWSLTHPFFSDFALSQAKDVATTLLGCLIIRVLVEGEERKIHFARVCVFVVAFGCFLKVMLLSYALLTGASVTDYVDMISATFGVKLMTVDLGDAGGRLLLPSDNLVPICLFALLGLRKRIRIHWFLAACFFVLLIVSSLYTFSRFIWASTLLAVILGLLVGRRDRLNIVYLSLTGAAVVILFPLIATIVELRYSSALSGASDMDRVTQISALRELFISAPFIGHGLGSYSLTLIRSYDLPYSYEIQLLALLGQLGILGVGILALYLMNFYRKAFSIHCNSWLVQVALLVLLADVLGAGLFNPSLLVSMSAVSYGLLFVLASLNRTPSVQKPNHRQWTEYSFARHVAP